MQRPESLPRLITLLTGIMAGMVMLLPPLIHLFLNWDHAYKNLAMEVHVHKIFLNKFISHNPETWFAQDIRMKAILEDIHTPGTSVRVWHGIHERVEAGQMVESLSQPSLTHEAWLHDFGSPTGVVEVTMSLRPLLPPVLLTWFSSSVFGLLLFFPLRKLTLTMVQQATDAMREAKEMAEANSRAKSDFLANMSHEIRTPMNAVIGLTDLALTMDMPPKVRSHLSKIANASQSLLRIINDILDYSKIEAGKLELEITEFFLRDVFDHLADLFRARVAEKNLELILCLAEECRYELTGDALRLEQVLLNLIGNAVKFTEEGEIEVQVRTLEKSAHQVLLEFAVRDTGLGMAPDQVDRLFQPFTQADSTVSRKFGGTGLGLSICKNLVTLMGGRIWVESRPGSGSLFRFTSRFPCKQVPAAADLVAPGDLAGLRALVVDDSEAAGQAMQHFLQLFGFAVTVARSGGEALQVLQNGLAAEEPCRLLLMDWHMPTRDGLQSLRHIQATLPPQWLPKTILLVPCNQEEHARQVGAVIGVNDYLSKPVNCSILFDTIMTVFGQEVARVLRHGSPLADSGNIMAAVGGARVLLVEDNHINQLVAREILEGVGLEVAMAGDGAEALQQLERGAFDAVFMDIQMPVMDGYTATRQIRMNPRFHQLPIIAMTAHAMTGDQEKSLAAGMNDHITKPIARKELFAALVKWIKPRPRPSLPVAEKACPLPGLDLDSALARINGNRRLLRSLLLEFQEEVPAMVDKIHTLLAGRHADDWTAAMRLVHTLKGMAGNLSAHQLLHVIHELQGLVHLKQVEAFPTVLAQLNRALELAMTDMAAWLAGEPDPAPPGATLVNREETIFLMLDLDRLLASMNVKSFDRFSSLKAALAGVAPVETRLQHLEGHLTRYDFATARTILAELAQSLGVSLKG